MKEVIIIGGRSSGKTDVVETVDETINYMIAQIKAAGLTTEDLQAFAVRVNEACKNNATAMKTFAEEYEIARLASIDLNFELDKVVFPPNSVNPYSRQYQRKRKCK